MLMFFWGIESKSCFVMWKVYELNKLLHKSNFKYGKLNVLVYTEYIYIYIYILPIEILERTQDENIYNGRGIDMMNGLFL